MTAMPHKTSRSPAKVARKKDAKRGAAKRATGKPTLLLVSALERADAAQRETLARVGHPDLGDDEVAELQAVLAATGALEAVEEEITRLSAASRAALDVDVIPASARSALGDMVDLVSFRTS